MAGLAIWCNQRPVLCNIKNHREGNEDILQSIEQIFYVDSCLQSLPTPESARLLVDKMRQCLALGGFEIQQWASNVSSDAFHLPDRRAQRYD